MRPAPSLLDNPPSFLMPSLRERCLYLVALLLLLSLLPSQLAANRAEAVETTQTNTSNTTWEPDAVIACTSPPCIYNGSLGENVLYMYRPPPLSDQPHVPRMALSHIRSIQTTFLKIKNLSFFSLLFSLATSSWPTFVFPFLGPLLNFSFPPFYYQDFNSPNSIDFFDQ